MTQGPQAPARPAGTAAAVRRVEHRFLRTARHPAAGAVDRATAFDPLYESAGYVEVPEFGYYAEVPSAVHLGKTIAE